ncbi:YbfB/YjiJ family MFS transporter [Actinoallomurus rhizosphaericola]|uniref:YbfB/YjiJ family MFS transporter n=1 Tax=Actinoallomurus rhizosphaericola TaxID=2952536 RepID=UPI00209238A7|nr:YbfB/YjiJ family MFS transporter [Actinoallomurus rhizosphaericola]MCO6000012.1 YbfB/YjiJ family MFS transporter [Actinoallomurus rhizosphaericola]
MSTAFPRRRTAPSGAVHRSAWIHVFQAAAALAAGMGVGRFVYTPILPLMHAQAGLSAGNGADLATANYVGYLAGALLGIALPRLTRSPAVLRGSLLVMTAALAAMPSTHSTAVWLALRLLAGAASALIFVITVSSLFGRLRGHSAHLVGWAFGGVGAGIALSGLLVLILRSLADWRAAWWASAGLAALLTAASWTLRPESAPQPEPAPRPGPAPRRDPVPRPGASVREQTSGPRTHRWFTALFASYTLEGIGYIIAGTFLVAAVEQGSPGWIGGCAWVLVGLAAVPSSAFWAWSGRRWSRPDLLIAALAVQAVGIALPALIGGVAAALLSALLFGATFLGVSTIALAAGAHLRFPRSVALLTAGYSVGQILGPLAVTPLLHHGYHQALLLAAVVVLAAATAAAVLRVGFPHHMPALGHPASRS